MQMVSKLIVGPERSKALQIIAFKFGYKWVSLTGDTVLNSQQVINTHKNYLCFDHVRREIYAKDKVPISGITPLSQAIEYITGVKKAYKDLDITGLDIKVYPKEAVYINGVYLTSTDMEKLINYWQGIED